MLELLFRDPPTDSNTNLPMSFKFLLTIQVALSVMMVMTLQLQHYCFSRLAMQYVAQ